MPVGKHTKIYKFTHLADDWILTNIKERTFTHEWLVIEPEGRITVKGTNGQGYAWDGCSPKGFCCGRIWGTPDGRMDPLTGKPLTYYASMFHDALYQFKGQVEISRKEADLLFYLLLKEAGFRFRLLYYAGVRLGGAFYGKWKVKKSQDNIRITACSWLEDQPSVK